jgi:hypothetical protein
MILSGKIKAIVGRGDIARPGGVWAAAERRDEGTLDECPAKYKKKFLDFPTQLNGTGTPLRLATEPSS